jgi:hypothetical protein
MRNIININCNVSEKLEVIFKRFVSSINENYIPNEFDFYYNGQKLDDYSKSLNTIIAGNNDITIFAERKLRIIKCPKCTCNDCIINLDNYRIVFYGCCKNDIRYRLLDEYDESQIVDFSKIKCKVNGCKKTMNNSLQDFYICMDCTKSNKHTFYLCSEHNSEGDHAAHEKKRYDDKHYYCEEHFGKFIEYCFKCEKNLCHDCLNKHKEIEHIVKSYESLTPNLNDIKDNLKKIKEKISKLKTKIEDIKDNLDGALKMYENYYKIANDITEKYELYNQDLKNYRILRSFLYLKKSNKKIIEDLDEVLEGENMNNKIKFLINIYKTDREIYNNILPHEVFTPKHQMDEYNEWEEENAIKEIKQNTPQNKGKTKKK